MSIELLSPCGDIDSLKAAIYNGANAVYLGLDNFSARANAVNFNKDNLAEWIKYAHTFSVKVYITMNTLIKDSEMNSAIEMAKFVHLAQADAIIVQDLGLAKKIKSTMSDIVLHASTQMGVHNLEGAQFCKSFGFDRVVLSRETLLSDIANIRENCDIELEYFVQGALCVSFSGNCYFSSVVSGLSGNRGKCLQLCRKPYSLMLGDKLVSQDYWLSAADLMLLDNLEELIDGGIISFKIEGRMRRCEYVAQATRSYRQKLDDIVLSKAVKSHSSLSTEPLRRDISKVFNRGNFTSGYIGNKANNIIYPYLQSHLGLSIGTVRKVIGDIAIIDSDFNLSENDGVKFIRDSREVGSAKVALRGANKTTFIGDICAGDFVHLTSDSIALEKLRFNENKVSFSLAVVFTENDTVAVDIFYNNKTFMFSSTFVTPKAIKQPLDEESAKFSLTKSHNSSYNIVIDNIRIIGDVFITKAQINSLRRTAIEFVENNILDSLNIEASSTKFGFDLTKYKFFDSDNISRIVEISHTTQLTDILIDFADAIIFNPNSFEKKAIEEFFSICTRPSLLNIPKVLKGEDVKILKELLVNPKIKNVVVNNVGAFALTEGKTILAGHNLNIFNSEFKIPKILSIEAGDLISCDDFVLHFGYATLMTFNHCPFKAIEGSAINCMNCGREELFLIDTLSNKFSFRKQKISHCYHELINCKPTDSSSHLNKSNKYKHMYYTFNSMKNSDIHEIILCIANNRPFSNDYTRGYLGKGIK